MNPRILDLTGHTYGKLTVIELDTEKTRKVVVYWKCLCECGNYKSVTRQALRDGNTKRCDFHINRSEKVKKTTIPKGKRRTRPKNYYLWRSMLSRCYDVKSISYKYYGAKGITVCERWKVFKNFTEDMGSRPLNHTLDRINNALPYCKDNCKWSTIEQQNRNKSTVILYEINGETLCLAQAVAKYGKVGYVATKYRIRNGMNVHDALFTEKIK